MTSQSQMWLTTEQVAELLQVGQQSVQRWIRDGELPALDLGGRAGYRIKPDDLEAFIEARYGQAGKAVA